MKTVTGNLVLDSTLRYLYSTLRKGNFTLMAIEFEHRGKKYRADTAKEAAELQFELGRHDAMFGMYGSEDSKRIWTADLAMDLLNGIGDAQKNLIAALVEQPFSRSMNSDTLAKKMGLDSEMALAGVVSGLSKQLRKMSIAPADLYRVNVEWRAKGKVRTFELSADFASALAELGWPDTWRDAKKKGATDAPTK